MSDDEGSDASISESSAEEGSQRARDGDDRFSVFEDASRDDGQRAESEEEDGGFSFSVFEDVAEDTDDERASDSAGDGDETPDESNSSPAEGGIDGPSAEPSEPERDDDSAETSDLEDAPVEVGDDLVERVAEYDEELAAEVEAVAEKAIELNRTLESYEEEDEEVEDLRHRIRRVQADYQNYKKRAKKRQQQIKARATEDLVTRLVNVRDNLKRALGEEHADVESIQEGVEMTLREFDRVLSEENVTEIDPEPGTEVDPQRHEVMIQIDSDQPEGTIAEVYNPGYEMSDKVIQTAQVTVSNGAHHDGTEDDDATSAPDDDATDAHESDDDAGAGDAIELGGDVEDEPGED